MGFGEIIGQEQALAILRQTLGNKRLHHAYLFTGPEGVGKRTTAMALAMALHCGQRNNDSCGACAECARIKARNHPDVREIEPLSGKKEIGIQQIRDMEKELHFRSFSGAWKVAIIDPATLLNAASQNALLKTLEEPPGQSLLILISPNSGALLPTLRSRCVRVSFGPLPHQLITGFIASKKGLVQEEAQILAAASMGSLGTALRMNVKELRERRVEWRGILCGLKAGDYRSAMESAEALASSREGALKFFEWAESWYRDLLVCQLRRDDRQIINADMLPELQGQQQKTTPESLLSAVRHASEAARRIRRNLNRRMVLEEFLFGVVRSH
jgi:DNA polymerase-3 subunit delta'